MDIQVKDYKGFSITNIVLSILCICNTGIVAIIFAIMALMKSNQVQQFVAIGDQARAIEASSKAKLFNYISLGVLFLGIILGIILSVTGFFASLFDNV
jgi:cytochrome b subunit of formate dehydrogenase